MLEYLKPELLAEVLRHMPRKAQRSARLTARALDAAWRVHLAEEVALEPNNTGGTLGLPDWSRFPRLRCLRLDYWGQDAWKQLQQAFLTPPAVAGLAGVEDLVATDCELAPPMWALILMRLPGLKTLDVGADHIGDELEPIAGLTSILAAASPRLEMLRAPMYDLDAAGAALLARLPALTMLEVGGPSFGFSPHMRRADVSGVFQRGLAWAPENTHASEAAVHKRMRGCSAAAQRKNRSSEPFTVPPHPLPPDQRERR